MKRLSLLITCVLLALFTFCQNKNFLFEGTPVFHGAKIVGNYPNTDFMFTIPATGDRPITFGADNLPVGLSLDPSSGIIKGKVGNAAEYKIKVSAQNTKGKAEEELKIVVGDNLCLTPAMGWNSWNVFTKNIDEKMLMEMADAMVANGMRDEGYQYINIDDFWHSDSRDSLGRPVPDAKKFPHGMKYVSDYMHSKGLKLGIYSCAGNMTCGRRFGGYTYEEIDAKSYAEWGIDLLKYDYCYAPPSQKVAVERYSKMGNALKHSGRSIVFSICEWGFRKPWLWTAKVGGHYSRSTPDIMDTWKFPSIFVYSTMAIINREEKLWKYAGPGHWNDPDMLIVGNYGKGNATSRDGIFKGMTDAEYRSHFSLWCMFSAPLLASCDLRKMNDATSTILTNPEILAIDQDELGEQAKPIYKLAGIRVYLKHLKDGSVAVAVLNTSKSTRKFDLKENLLGLSGTYAVHDVWQHADAGTLKDKISVTIQSHETMVFRISK
ncbi:MAG: putative alpha-galactosidase/melibiase [Bacteroidota bacterium]|nr:putative alpha-galactosidase/melibiase [Bacteroidota bacterium]